MGGWEQRVSGGEKGGRAKPYNEEHRIKSLNSSPSIVRVDRGLVGHDVIA